MADYSRPVQGIAWQTRIMLADFAVPGSWKTNPAIQVGDFKIDIDGAGFSNLANTPTVSPAGGVAVLVALTQAETTGALVTVVWQSQASPKTFSDGGFVLLPAAT